jgi:hypothetical protein
MRPARTVSLTRLTSSRFRSRHARVAATWHRRHHELRPDFILWFGLKSKRAATSGNRYSVCASSQRSHSQPWVLGFCFARAWTGSFRHLPVVPRPPPGRVARHPWRLATISTALDKARKLTIVRAGEGERLGAAPERAAGGTSRRRHARNGGVRPPWTGRAPGLLLVAGRRID